MCNVKCFCKVLNNWQPFWYHLFTVPNYVQYPWEIMRRQKLLKLYLDCTAQSRNSSWTQLNVVHLCLPLIYWMETHLKIKMHKHPHKGRKMLFAAIEAPNISKTSWRCILKHLRMFTLCWSWITLLKVLPEPKSI